MKKYSLFSAVVLFCTVIIACSKENEQNLKDTLSTTPACDTANMKFTANVLPILSTNCYSCHGNGRAFGGVNLDTYANVKLVATDGSLLGSITHASNFSPMPKNAAQLAECDINKIRAWINRGALNN